MEASKRIEKLTSYLKYYKYSVKHILRIVRANADYLIAMQDNYRKFIGKHNKGYAAGYVAGIQAALNTFENLLDADGKINSENHEKDRKS